MTLKAKFTGNPLIEPSPLPYGAPPLADIREEHFKPAYDWALAKIREELAAIRDNPEPPTFENTIEALECAGDDLIRIQRIFINKKMANNTWGLQDLEKDYTSVFSELTSDICTDQKLAGRVQKVYAAKDDLALNEEESILLDTIYTRFEKRGAHLPPDKQKRLGKISARLAELQNSFNNYNVAHAKQYRKWISNIEELDGIPQDLVDGYKEFARKEGAPDHWCITLGPPPRQAISYADNRALRRELQTAMDQVSFGGDYDTRDIVMEIVKLRHERASLLGHASHAEYALKDNMAGTPEAVGDFLLKSFDAYWPEAWAFVENLKQFAYERDGITDFQIWDLSYYSRLLKEEEFGFSAEEVRPYFELNNVLDGAFKHAEKLFGISFLDKSDTYPGEHEDSKVFEVLDRESGEVLGLLYTDYYSRPGKKGGAWMNIYRHRGLRNGQNQIPVVTNICNFSRPAEGKPTLLPLEDVKTLFHEFGHALNELLAEGTYPTLTGSNVKVDVLEIHSQLMENWLRMPEALQTFARHHLDDTPLPEEMIEKILSSSNFGQSVTGLRQNFLAILDMAWHNQDPAEIKSVEQLEHTLWDLAYVLPDQNILTSARFGHLFAGGYDAAYYSYDWARAIEADMFESFLAQGIYNHNLGKKLRAFYAAGGTRDPNDLVMEFLDRDKDEGLDAGAKFRREGLTPPASEQGGAGPRPA